MRNAEWRRNLKIKKGVMKLQIATNIKTLRQKKGLSQEKLAEMAGISRERLAKYEGNFNTFDFATGLKLAKALGVTCEELAEGIKEEKGNE